MDASNNSMLPSIRGGIGQNTLPLDMSMRTEDEIAERRGNRALLLLAIRNDDSEAAISLITSGKVAPMKQRIVKASQQQPVESELPLEVAAAYENQAVVALLLEKGFAAEHTRSLAKASSGNGAAPALSSGASAAGDDATIVNGGAMSVSGADSVSLSGFQPSRPRSQGHHHRKSTHSQSSRNRSNKSRSLSEGPQSFIQRQQQVGKFRSQPRVRPKKGSYSPLHWASYKGHLGIVCLLLRYGFDPSCVDTDGNTSLHLAATACSEAGKGQHATVIEVLLSENVDVFARNMFGNRALQLATDPRARILLQSAEQSDRARDNMLSLSRIIQAEETLAKLLTTIFRDNAQDEQDFENGRDIFADSPPVYEKEHADGGNSSPLVNPMVLSDATEAEQQARRQLQKDARIKASRTQAVSSLTTKLQTRIQSLARAVDVAVVCKVNEDMLNRGKRTLRDLKHCQHCEQASLSMLDEVIAFNDLHKLKPFSIILQKARETSVPRHVFLRTSRVYLYLEARMKLHLIYEKLSQYETSEMSQELVQELHLRLRSFVQRRVQFGPIRRSSLIQDPVEIAAAALSGAGLPNANRDTSTSSMKKGRNINSAGGKRGKKGNGARKVRKSDAGDSLEDEQKTPEELAAEAEIAESQTEAARADALWNEDPDDYLLRVAGALLMRLQIEQEINQWATKEFSKSADSAKRIADLEAALARFDELFMNSDTLAQADCGVEVSETIIQIGQGRVKQLQRDLKNAKRNLADKAAQLEASNDTSIAKVAKKRDGKKK